MSKDMNKIVLKCILAVCVILVPFIFANYFILNYFMEHGKYFFEYDEMILSALQIILTIPVGLVLRHKNKNTLTENKKAAKKYMTGSLVAFLIIAILYFTEIYQDIYFNVTFSLQIDDAPLFLFVCWEQILNGKFLLSLSLCIFICFIGTIRFYKNKTQ